MAYWLNNSFKQSTTQGRNYLQISFKCFTPSQKTSSIVGRKWLIGCIINLSHLPPTNYKRFRSCCVLIQNSNEETTRSTFCCMSINPSFP